MTFHSTAEVEFARLIGTLVLVYIATYWCFCPPDAGPYLFSNLNSRCVQTILYPEPAVARLGFCSVLVSGHVMLVLQLNRAEREKRRAGDQQDSARTRRQLQARAQEILGIDRSGDVPGEAADQAQQCLV